MNCLRKSFEGQSIQANEFNRQSFKKKSILNANLLNSPNNKLFTFYKLNALPKNLQCEQLQKNTTQNTEQSIFSNVNFLLDILKYTTSIENKIEKQEIVNPRNQGHQISENLDEKYTKNIVKINNTRGSTLCSNQNYKKNSTLFKLPAVSNQLSSTRSETNKIFGDQEFSSQSRSTKASKGLYFPSPKKSLFEPELAANKIRASIADIFESSQLMKLRFNNMQRKFLSTNTASQYKNLIVQTQQNENQQKMDLITMNQGTNDNQWFNNTPSQVSIKCEKKSDQEIQLRPKIGWKELIDKLTSKKIISGKFRRKNQSCISIQSYESNQTENEEEFEIWDNTKDVRLASIFMNEEEKSQIQNFLTLYKARFGQCGFPGKGEPISNEQVIQIAVQYAAQNKKLIKKYFPSKFVEFDDQQDYSKPYDKEKDENFKEFRKFCEEYFKTHLNHSKNQRNLANKRKLKPSNFLQ